MRLQKLDECFDKEDFKKRHAFYKILSEFEARIVCLEKDRHRQETEIEDILERLKDN